MTDEMRDADRLELEQLRAQRALEQRADAVLERMQRSHMPLERALEAMMPLLLDATGGAQLCVHTYDETLSLRDFGASLTESDTVLREAIDVAGEDFGHVLLDLGREPTPLDALLLTSWTEALDNFLGSIASARLKFKVIREISRALREPLLEDGLVEAIAVLREHVPVNDMLLVFHHDEDEAGASLHYKLIVDDVDDVDRSDYIREHALDLITGEALERHLEALGFPGTFDDIPIYDDGRNPPVGRILVSNAHGGFSTFDHDLLERFADHLHQRVVDFNKEWKDLSRCFPPPVVRRLLREPDYRERFLLPREREVAILYCDIASFSVLSEQILKEPTLIGRLIDLWSQEVVQILWSHGGLFDNMVGDCIIGLWGPPFFDDPPSELCRKALEATVAINTYTQSLAQHPDLAHIDFEFGVSSGLNYTNLFVGLFGPNENFTGFSSGMNNAARLQGVASRHEILCMESFVEAMGSPERFGPLQSAQVKNIAVPLRYHAWKEP